MIKSGRTVNRLPVFFCAAIILAALACQTPYTAELLTSPGQVLYHDDFEDPTSGWGRNVTASGVTDYAGGGYRITVSAPRYDYRATSGLTFANVRVEADAIKIGGPEINRIGLICRYQDAQDYYFFIISSDGYYGIGKVKDDHALLLGGTEMQRASAVRPGTTTNHLRADCAGSTLAFYVNGGLVGLANDAEFTSGDVGILAGAFEEAGVDVLFDNFVVYKP